MIRFGDLCCLNFVLTNVKNLIVADQINHLPIQELFFITVSYIIVVTITIILHSLKNETYQVYWRISWVVVSST